MSIEDISNQIAEKQKELKQMIANREIVETEKLQISRQMLELRLKSNELDIALSKAKSNCAQLSLEIKELTHKFWNVKNG